MQLGLSENLSALVARRFTAAKEGGHLIFSPTQLSNIQTLGIPVTPLLLRTLTHTQVYGYYSTDYLARSLACNSSNSATAQPSPKNQPQHPNPKPAMATHRQQPRNQTPSRTPPQNS